MDKEFSNDNLPPYFNPLIILKLSKHTAPDGTVYYRGNVQNKGSVDMADLAKRTRIKHSSISPELHILAFQELKTEIYEALAEGKVVDCGIGTLSLKVKGKFNYGSEPFDPERHEFIIVFTPSPRLRQLLKRARGHRKVYQTDCEPDIAEVSSWDHRGMRTCPFNTVFTGERFVHIYGRNIRIAGDHPQVGVRFYSPDKKQCIPAMHYFRNERGNLTIGIPDGLTPGEWVLELSTQFTASYHLCKEPRTTTYAFTVADREPAEDSNPQ